MRDLLQLREALAGDEPEEVDAVDVGLVARRADPLEVVVDALAQGGVVEQLVVRLPEVQRADVADRHQRVGAGRRRVREDPRVQVEVVVRLGLVDVAGAAARDRVELDELVADLRRERLRRGVELLRRQARETPLVVGDLLHGEEPRRPAPARRREGTASTNERGSSYGSVGPPSIDALVSERCRSAFSPWTMPAAPSRPCVLTRSKSARDSSHVRRDVRRERRRHLALREERHRELDLLDRLHDALRLRHELGLAEPAGRLRRGDEPLRVLRAHVAVDAVLHRLGAELRDRVARVDALRAALVAEVAARAVPDPVLLAVALEALDRRAVARVADEAEALRERRRAEEVRVGLHRVALRDAAAAVDAERLLVDRVHPLLRDDVLRPRPAPSSRGSRYGWIACIFCQNGSMSTTRSLTIGRLPIAEMTGTLTVGDEVVDPHLAGEDGAAVHAHPARAADHHPAALPVGERAVDLVLDGVEGVEQRRLVRRRRPRTA